ncbi:hypothetical protein Tco_1544837 [Tanacetum coccineum]
MWVVCGGGVTWGGEEGGGDEWCCDGGGMIRGDDVDGCGGGRRLERWPKVGRKDGEAPKNMRGGMRCCV